MVFVATETLKNLTAQALVAVGTTSSGSTKTAQMSMGTLNKDAWDATKMMAIVDALEPCISNEIVELQKTGKYQITE